MFINPTTDYKEVSLAEGLNLLQLLADFLLKVETHGYYDQSVAGTLEMLDWLKIEVIN